MSKKKNIYPNNKKKSIRKDNRFQLLAIILIVILINFIGKHFYTRLDLTAEKRYSLAPESKQILRNVKDIAFFKVYLEGEFPADYKRLRNATKELLDEMRAYNSNIQYEFINPNEPESTKERSDFHKLLLKKGIAPASIRYKNSDGAYSQKVIFPGCLFIYKGEEEPLSLLQDSKIEENEAHILNNSIQNLEFLFISAIKRHSRARKHTIGVLQGHGEVKPNEMFSFLTRAQRDYSIEKAEIGDDINALSTRFGTDSTGYEAKNKFDALIIPGPTQPFTNKEKFILDQYIMHGGKVLWLVDPVYAKMDSIQNSENTVGLLNDINFKDMLFNYGVRVNDVLLKDLSCLKIPLNIGKVGNRPNIQFFPWPYFPLVSPGSKHPIVKNLDLISTQFPGTLDTLANDDIKKTILLSSSENATSVQAPAIISLSEIRANLDKRIYHGGKKPVAVLLEGKFTSAFKNRVPSKLKNESIIDFEDHIDHNAMIVISNSALIKNQFTPKDGVPLPLGYNRYTRQTFGNEYFALNVLNYLTDGDALISLRSREVELRPLDVKKIEKDRLFWQTLNTVTPLFLLILFGIIHFIIRKRKYN
ncbi:MAG: gliding motility-associated ABC transporter substrate-binding protein GldG [Bacteroidales bacterium]